MRQKTSAQHTNIHSFAIFIGVLITLLILVACILKIVFLFQKSVFDEKQQFVLEEKEPGAMRFFVFSPQNQSLHTLLLSGKSFSDPRISLGIPVDATFVDSTDISSFSSLANTLLFHKNSLHASLTIIDAINLFIFIHTADTTKTVDENGSIQNISNEKTLLSTIFTDPTIYREAVSIAIVNGTGTSGLGGKIAGLLTNIGANVISVTTADTPSPTSSVEYTGNSSYTLSRIVHLLGLPEVRLSTAKISDITIVLGADFKISNTTNIQ